MAKIVLNEIPLSVAECPFSTGSLCTICRNHKQNDSLMRCAALKYIVGSEFEFSRCPNCIVKN